MSNFKIGQEVVCIEGYSGWGFELVTDKQYTVKDTVNCSCSSSIDVGLKGDGDIAQCRICKDVLNIGSECFHLASRFISLEEYEEMNEVAAAMGDETKLPVLTANQTL